MRHRQKFSVPRRMAGGSLRTCFETSRPRGSASDGSADPEEVADLSDECFCESCAQTKTPCLKIVQGSARSVYLLESASGAAMTSVLVIDDLIVLKRCRRVLEDAGVQVALEARPRVRPPTLLPLPSRSGRGRP